MNYGFLLISLLISTICFGQTGASGSGGATAPGYNNGLISTNNRYNSSNSKGYISYEEVVQEYSGIDDSPYLHGGEITVDIISLTDSVFKNVLIKYDLYNNEVVVKKKDGSTIVLDQKFYKGFIYKKNKKEERYMRLKANDNTFYRVFFRTNDFAFYKHHKTRIEKVSRHVPGLEIKPQKFVQIKEYFVLRDQASLSVKLAHGEPISYFPKDYAKQVPAIKKKLKIKKLRKEKQYIKIIEAFSEPEKL